MKPGMPFEIRRRCELTMTRFRGGQLTADAALAEFFRLMRLPESQEVQAAQFQDYVDAILNAAEKTGDPELEKEVMDSWKP